MTVAAMQGTHDRLTGPRAGIGVALAILLAAGPGLADVPALTVATEPAQSQQAYQSRRVFVGRIEALRQSDLGFELGGRLEQVIVDDGDRVDAGAVLAVLDTARLEARRAELTAALQQVRADLGLARATLARTEEAAGFNGVSGQKDWRSRGLPRSRSTSIRVRCGRLTPRS